MHNPNNSECPHAIDAGKGCQCGTRGLIEPSFLPPITFNEWGDIVTTLYAQAIEYDRRVEILAGTDHAADAATKAARLRALADKLTAPQKQSIASILRKQ